MDWVGPVAGIIAGVSSGFLSAVATPFATRRAEEVKTRQATRRESVAQGRALVEEAVRERWSPPKVAKDPRYLDLRPHLPASTRDTYGGDPNMLYAYAGGGPTHTELADAIDALATKWRLV